MICVIALFFLEQGDRGGDGKRNILSGRIPFHWVALTNQLSSGLLSHENTCFLGCSAFSRSPRISTALLRTLLYFVCY